MLKSLYPILFCLSILLLASCREEENESAEPGIRDIALSSSQLHQGESMEIDVLIEKPTPCHYIDQVDLSVSGTTYTYDILLETTGEICAQVIEEERVTVIFEPGEAGEYTLNFLINGRQQQSRQVEVRN